MTKLNPTLAILQSQWQVMLISVSFEGSAKLYTYKTGDLTIIPGDRVIVKTPSEYKVCSVQELNPSVDMSDDINYKWIIQRVDHGDYDRLIKIEGDYLKEISP